MVILVEDELSLAEALKLSLEKMDFKVMHFTTIETSKKYFEVSNLESSTDFIVLDRNLPDGDGLDLCPWLRNRKFSGPILMLTASGSIEDKVHGLDSGADDYLCKPFSWDELAARMRALERRKSTVTVSVGKTEKLWACDDGLLKIKGFKGWVTLTPLEYKLAKKLISAEGTILSRKDLLQDVWGFQFLPQTRTVDFFLGKLRKSFEENPAEPKHFLTVRGAGYKFQQ